MGQLYHLVMVDLPALVLRIVLVISSDRLRISLLDLERIFEVHPALSWVEIQSTAVEQYSRFEVFDVAIASRSSLNRHDLTVDPFSYRIGDPVRTVGHNVIDSLLQTPS
jgi:hypothetical protein